MTNPLRRISGKLLPVVLAVGGMTGGLVAHAQSDVRAAEGDAIAASSQRANDYALAVQQWRAEHQAARIVVNTDENHRFADQIYATAFAGIDKVLKTQGKAAALEYSQHPEENRALTLFIKKAGNGQYLLATYVIADAIDDAPKYINDGKPLGSLVLSDSEWKDAALSAQTHINALTAGETELGFLRACYKTSGYFGAKTKSAAGAVLSASDRVKPVEVASSRP
jgi:hypothetical protein